MSNMKQLGLALLQYAQDNEETCVPEYQNPSGNYKADPAWLVLLLPYIGGNNSAPTTSAGNVASNGIFQCPDEKSIPLSVGDIFNLPAGVYDSWGMGFGVRESGYTLNNFYWHDPELGEMFNQITPSPAPLSTVQNPAGYIFCTEGDYFDIANLSSHADLTSTAQGAVPVGGKLTENNYPLACSIGGGCIVFRHNGGANAAFFDGHAKWMPSSVMLTMVPLPADNVVTAANHNYYNASSAGMCYKYLNKATN